MFLETVGKLCFSKIRPFFFYLFLILPFVGACLYLGMQSVYLQELEGQFIQSCKKGKNALKRKGEKEKFLEKYSHAAPYFLDTHIESLLFLQKEKRALRELLQHPALTDKREIEERLHFLEENKLLFAEETLRTSGQIHESEEKQRTPVQMSEEDLKKLLCCIENIPIDSFSPQENSPQILLTDFQFEKKESSLKTPFLEVEMKLLKREIKK